MLLIRIIKFFKQKIWYTFNYHKFAFLSPSVILQKGIRIEGMKNISLGDNVVVQRMTWLAAVPLTGFGECKLIIGKGSIIGNFNHIYATRSIEIGENVLTADKVYISDCTHNYEDITLPIVKQSIKQLSPIKIGDGTWLGENVCIIGVNIGKGCVIGANSVVITNIPDYSVAVGAPAKVIKQYNHQTKQWEKV